jgi:hypothetical protein
VLYIESRKDGVRVQKSSRHLQIRSDMQARVASEPTLLGKRQEPDLRRHQLHEPSDHANVVSVVRLFH